MKDGITTHSHLPVFIGAIGQIAFFHGSATGTLGRIAVNRTGTERIFRSVKPVFLVLAVRIRLPCPFNGGLLPYPLPSLTKTFLVRIIKLLLKGLRLAFCRFAFCTFLQQCCFYDGLLGCKRSHLGFQFFCLAIKSSRTSCIAFFVSSSS